MRRWSDTGRRMLLAAASVWVLAGVPGALAADGDKTSPQSIKLADKSLDFDAEVATMKLANPKGEVQAEIVTTAFLLRGADPAKRPVMFAVNGGPGASSAWLDLGAIGPWRVPFGLASAAAAPLVNADTWLDFADLVFIDPPGTGFSRVTGGDEARRQFYSVDGDIDTLATVARRWLEGHGRLLSPKFIVGESYGGFRAPRLARALLDKQGVGVSGLVMISPVLDFNGRDEPWNPFTYVDSLPSMAAAYRHATKREDVADVEAYARGAFLTDLMAGESDTAAVDRLATHVTALTGLDAGLVRRRAGRIGISTFLRDRSPGLVGSPYDATNEAIDPFPSAANDNSPDPVLDGMRGPVTSAMLFVYHQWLGWQPDGAPARQYSVLNEQVAHDWDYGRRGVRPDSFGPLRQYLALDPSTRALVAHGLTDLVTPYFADQLLVQQAPSYGPVTRLTLRTYAGGHMFYSNDESRAALHRDASALVTDALAGRP